MRKQRASFRLSHEYTFNIWEGSVRSTKTITSIIRWIEFVRKGPPGPLLMIGKTERTLKRNIIDVIVDMLGRRRARYMAGNGEFWLCGRMIYVVGANDETAQEKIRGLTLAGAYGDEITTWPESFWAMLKSRLSVKGSKFFGTTNPDNPSHWLKKDLNRAALWLQKKGRIVKRDVGTVIAKTGEKVLNMARFSFHLLDNEYLLQENPQYIEDLMNDYTGLWYRRYVDGDWVVAEGAVYSDWDADRHVVSELPDMVCILSHGIDYGTTNPTAGVEIGLGVDDRLYVIREWVPKKASTDKALADDYHKWRNGVNPDLVFVDPNAASLKRQLTVDGVPGVHNAHNSVNDGLRVCSSLLHADLLRVHESCTMTIEEIEGYVWDPDVADKGEDKPLKENDHWCDALRYAIYSSRTRWRHVLDRRLKHVARTEQRLAPAAV